MSKNMSENRNENRSENKRETDKVFAGLPYLYRSKGLPGEVYEVRFKEDIDQALLNRAIVDTLERYPYFAVRFQEEKGDFFSVKNDLPLEAFHTQELIPLGGEANHYHMMGVSFWGKVLKISFHHGLTDGRGAKSFLETLVNFYADYDVQKKQEGTPEHSKNESEGILKQSGYDSEVCSNYSEDGLEEVRRKHHEKVSELSDEEYIDPCENKHELTGKSGKVDGLASKGFKLPETANKSGHRRYELRFSQKEFMEVCKKYGASPIILLSIMMSRGIRNVYPENDKPIISNFPMDARKILGCDVTFKNCVKSMSLPYGETEQKLSMEELAAHYKELLNKQKDHDYCAKEFNNIVMFLGLIGHIHSFKGRQKLLGFMENLALDTYLISYVGQFDVPEDYVDEVHLYSNCSDGLVLNMTCQSGDFIIDLTQDFESAAYVEALQKEFAAEGISVKGSDEILFETPYDELAEIITPAPDTAEQLKGIWESFAAAAKASAQAAKEREAASLALSASIQERAMHKPGGAASALTGVSDGQTEARPASAKGHSAPAVTAMYYDLATGTMKTFDPTKNTKEQLENLVRSTPSIFAS